jgi:hypothetical protein
MATATKSFFRGSASTSNTTLYTVPSSTTAVITNIVVNNTSSTSATYSILLDSVNIETSNTIPGNGSAYIDLKQVLDATKIISGSASTTSVRFHISGVEIS